jgi:hypothetical protein
MGLICSTSGALGNVPLNADCREALAQIQKTVIQKVFSSGTTLNTIADPTLLASWTPLLAATDNTKVVQTPYLNAPASEAGEARTFGGGNETRGGVELIIGSDPSSFEAMMYDQKQNTIEALKAYKEQPNIGVWFVDENGDIGCLADDLDTPTTYYPIPIQSFFVGDKKFGNYDEPDMNKIMWQMAADWSDKFTVVRPTDFNALTDLVTP